MKKRSVIGGIFLLSCLSACSLGVGDTDSAHPGRDPNTEAFEYIHQLSEQIYDGNGSWGQGDYGYRMALRDSYWRAEIYGFLADRNATYAERAEESIGYLLRAQSEGGTGAFGFPADINNPEFGDTIQALLSVCPACMNNGWIISLPGNDIAELYYDHGYALTAVARGYQRTEDQSLLAPIKLAADWSLDKPLTANVNYLSALSKGLSYAYQVIGDDRYLDKAIQLHRDGVLPFINEEGEAVDAHNARLEYHGFIVSGMVALRQSLPEGHPFITELDPVLERSIARMATRDLEEDGSYGTTWPGTNLLAWHELSASDPLTDHQERARERVLGLIRSYRDDIADEKVPFRLQKALYAYFFIGLYAIGE